MSSQPAGSTDHDLRVRQRQRDAAGKAAAAAGHDHHRRRARRAARAISTPTLPCPSITSTSSNDGTSVAPCSAASRAPIASRLSVARSKKTISAPARARPLDLHRRRVGRHDDRRRDARAPRRQRHALGMIARGESDHAARPLGLVQQHQPVGRAAQLEAAAVLQAFGLDPDPAALPIERAARACFVTPRAMRAAAAHRHRSPKAACLPFKPSVKR